MIMVSGKKMPLSALNCKKLVSQVLRGLFFNSWLTSKDTVVQYRQRVFSVVWVKGIVNIADSF